MTDDIKVRIRLEGLTSLLMHNIDLANPINDTVKQIKAISSKRKKTEADLLEMGRLEFMGGIYFRDDLGVYIPERCISATFKTGAKVNKKGTTIQKALYIPDDGFPLEYDGPRTPAELYADPRFVNVSAVQVSRARIMRTRPEFPTPWAVTVTAYLDPTVLNFDELVEAVTYAGRSGLLDFRPTHGRFKATIEKL